MKGGGYRDRFAIDKTIWFHEKSGEQFQRLTKRHRRRSTVRAELVKSAIKWEIISSYGQRCSGCIGERDSFLRGACTGRGGRATTLPVMATSAGVACTSRGEHEKRSAEDAMKAILFASRTLILPHLLFLRGFYFGGGGGEKIYGRGSSRKLNTGG